MHITYFVSLLVFLNSIYIFQESLQLFVFFEGICFSWNKYIQIVRGESFIKGNLMNRNNTSPEEIAPKSNPKYRITKI